MTRHRLPAALGVVAVALLAGVTPPAGAAPVATAAAASTTRSAGSSPPAWQVFGGPVMTADDTVVDGHVRPGVLVERQTLASATARRSARPYRDEATRLDTTSGKRVWSDGGDVTGGYAVNPPDLRTSFGLGQDQADYGTLALTANVTRQDGRTLRRASGHVWVEALCPTGTRYCWSDLGGEALSAPAVVNADGTIWVFARFADGMRGRVRPNGSSTWARWQPVGSGVSLRAAPAATLVAAVDGTDTIELVATGADDRVRRQLVSGIGEDAAAPGEPSGHWSRVRGAPRTALAPAVAYSEPTGRVLLAVVAPDGRVLLSSGGSAFTVVPGRLAGDFAPGLMGDNLSSTVDVAIRGRDRRTYLAASRDGGRHVGAWTEVPCVHGVRTYC